MSGPALVRQPIRKRFLTTSPFVRAFPEKTESRDSPAGTNRIQGSCWNGGQHGWRSEEHTSELQSLRHLVYRHFFPTRRSSDLRSLEHFPKRLNRGIPLRERIGFKVRAGMEASMDGETVFGRSACARRWSGTGWRYYSGDCGATWSEYQLCRALP